jgi:hypothetical protein
MKHHSYQILDYVVLHLNFFNINSNGSTYPSYLPVGFYQLLPKIKNNLPIYIICCYELNNDVLRENFITRE